MTLRADVLEIVWLALTVPGTLLAFESERQAVADRELVRRAIRRNGRDRELELELAIADADVASARWTGATLGLFALVGVLAATQPGAEGGRSITSWVLVVLLLVGTAGLTLRLYGQRRRRRALLRSR